MKRKMLFFDIDGTILSHRTYTISDDTRIAIKKAQQNGHLAFINTGRVQSSIPDFIREIGFDGFICGCGTSITYRDKVLLQTFIPKELTKQLIQDFRVLKIEAVLEGSAAIYFDDFTTNLMVREVRANHEANHFTIKSWDDPTISIDKFCIWTESESAAALFQEKYQEHFDFIDRNHRLYEVVPKGYSKASGIQYLMEYLDIPHENTYAFGDGENDLPMLTFAKQTIAMGNAPQSIQNIVTFVTDDVDENGITHALEHFGLI